MPIITGLYLQQNQVLTPVSTNVSITIAQSLVLIATCSDIWNNSINDASISYNLTSGSIKISGNFLPLGNGKYEANISAFQSVDVYTLTVVVEKANYTVVSKVLFVNAAWPSYLGIPEPYWLYLGIGVIVVGAVIITYSVVKNARIPKMTKRIFGVIKAVKKNNKTLNEKIAKYNEILQEKYNTRWKPLEIKAPFESKTVEPKNTTLSDMKKGGKK